MATPIDVFICYAKADTGLLTKLESHLAQLKRKGLICVWSDRSVLPGERTTDVVHGRLASARLILLLISAEFLASFDADKGEMASVFERERKGEARVVPILLQPCDWRHEPLDDRKALPKNHEPVSMWSNIDAALLDVVSGLREVVQDLMRSIAHTSAPDRASAPEAAGGGPDQKTPAPEPSREAVDARSASYMDSLPQTHLVFSPWPNLSGPLWCNSLPPTKLRLSLWNDEVS